MKEHIALEPINRDKCVVKGTHKSSGRTISVEPVKPHREIFITEELF